MTANQITFMPLAINMAGQRCLVVGGGRVATRKVNTLLAAGAAVMLAAPKIAEPLRTLADSGRIEWRQREYEPKILAHFLLVVAATDDRALERAHLPPKQKPAACFPATCRPAIVRG